MICLRPAHHECRRPDDGRIGDRGVRVAAQKYTVEAVQILAGIMRTGQSDQARIAAATALLNSGHGRPAQAVTGPEGDNLALAMKQIVRVHLPASHE